MNWGRKGALLMLAVVVFWAAMPASACLLGSRSAALPDCCHTTAHGCDPLGMSATSPCCQFHGENPAVTPAPQYATEHVQKLVLTPHLPDMRLPVFRSSWYGNTVATPPPQFPPGGAFALRI
jgi:hypothetical protein